MKRHILLLICCLVIMPLSLRAQDEEDFDLDSLEYYDDFQGDAGLGLMSTPIGLLSLFEMMNVRIDIGGNLVRNKSDNMSVLYFLSRHTQLAVLFSPYFFKERAVLRFGPAIGWKRYEFRKNVYLSYKDPSTEILPISANPQQITSKQLNRSGFRNFYLGMPIEITVYPLSNKRRSLSITVGGYLDYILFTRTIIRYTKNEKNYRDERSAPYATEKFQYGLNFRLGYGRFFSLYYRLGLSPIFNSDNGPMSEDEAKSSSLGITLGGSN